MREHGTREDAVGALRAQVDARRRPIDARWRPYACAIGANVAP